jgi:hypothetical protein
MGDKREFMSEDTNRIQEALAVVPRDVHEALTLGRSPSVVLAEAVTAAKALKEVIDSRQNKLAFNGRTYLQFEDWQTVARFYGVTANVVQTKFVEFGTVRGWEAKADAILIGNEQTISSADAMCLNDEPKWSTRPKYEWDQGKRTKVGDEPVPMFQLRSMAQTRACAKALRNALAWVVVLAGYSPTPAEEMDDGDLHYEYDVPPGDATQSKPVAAAAKPKKESEADMLLAQFQKNNFLNMCKKSGRTQQEILNYYGSIGIESLDEMKRKNFADALKWAMRNE